MKIYNIPETIHGLIFDIDNTLYRCKEYTQQQEEVIIRNLAIALGKDFSDVSKIFDDYRKTEAQKHDGNKPSLGNTCLHFGIPISENVIWREKYIKPSDYLQNDTNLQNTIKCLALKYKIIAVTNNPASVGRSTLETLGISEFFKTVIGLDTTMVSKPHNKPFLLAAENLKLFAENIISIGDRFSVDLEIPIELNMGGILVESMEDIYNLPEVI